MYLKKKIIFKKASYFDFRQAVRNAAQENADFDNIAIYVAKDCTGTLNFRP